MKQQGVFSHDELRKWEEKIEYKENEVHERTRKNGQKYQQIGYLSEDDMLADFMTWMRNKYPQLRQAVFHIENEGNSKFSKHGGDSLSKGKLAGVFDVISVYPKREVKFAEFKLSGGQWSTVQKELHLLWTSWGISITEIKTFEQWKNWIHSLL